MTTIAFHEIARKIYTDIIMLYDIQEKKFEYGSILFPSTWGLC